MEVMTLVMTDDEFINRSAKLPEKKNFLIQKHNCYKFINMNFRF